MLALKLKKSMQKGRKSILLIFGQIKCKTIFGIYFTPIRGAFDKVFLLSF